MLREVASVTLKRQAKTGMDRAIDDIKNGRLYEADNVEITAAAHKLDLSTEEPKTDNDFGIELPDELESQLSELTLTEESLADGNRLQDMHFPKDTLVMMVKRGNSFIVPNGQLELRPGDILLTIAQQSMMGSVA